MVCSITGQQPHISNRIYIQLAIHQFTDSILMLKIFGVFGDTFRYPVILLWTLLPIIMVLLIELYAPKYSKFHGIKLLWLVLPIMFILF